MLCYNLRWQAEDPQKAEHYVSVHQHSTLWGLINLPSLMAWQERKACRPSGPKHHRGAEKPHTSYTQLGTQWDGHNMPVPAPVQTISLFIILSAQCVLDWTCFWQRDCMKLLQGAETILNISGISTLIYYIFSCCNKDIQKEKKMHIREHGSDLFDSRDQHRLLLFSYSKWLSASVNQTPFKFKGKVLYWFGGI